MTRSYCKYCRISRRNCSHSLGVSVGASGALPLWNRGSTFPSLSPPAESTPKLQSGIVEEVLGCATYVKVQWKYTLLQVEAMHSKCYFSPCSPSPTLATLSSSEMLSLSCDWVRTAFRVRGGQVGVKSEVNST